MNPIVEDEFTVDKNSQTELPSGEQASDLMEYVHSQVWARADGKPRQMTRNESKKRIKCEENLEILDTSRGKKSKKGKGKGKGRSAACEDTSSEDLICAESSSNGGDGVRERDGESEKYTVEDGSAAMRESAQNPPEATDGDNLNRKLCDLLERQNSQWETLVSNIGVLSKIFKRKADIEDLKDELQICREMGDADGVREITARLRAMFKARREETDREKRDQSVAGSDAAVLQEEGTRSGDGGAGAAVSIMGAAQVFRS